MQKSTSVLATLATSLMLASCASPQVDATERSRVSATTHKNSQVFSDPAVAPMADAVAKGDVARIRALASQTDLAERGDKNVTLLEWAVFNQQPESMKALLDAGADPELPGIGNESVVHMAATVEGPEYLQILIKHGAKVDLPRTEDGWTPIFLAVLNKRHPQRDLLIAAGADLKRLDKFGNSLLHTQINDAETVLILLNAGVDPTHRNDQGVTFQSSFFRTQERLLNATAKSGRQEVRQWLTQHGIAIETP